MSPRIRPLVGPIAVLCLVLVAWQTIGVTMSEWRQSQFDREEIAQAEIASLIDRQDALRSDIASFSDQDITDLFWIAAQPGEATALVQSAISASASENGILLRSVTPFTPRNPTIQGAFGFRLEFEARLDQLTDFLSVFEYDQPALVVDKAIFRRVNRPGDSSLQPAVFGQIEVLAPVFLNGGSE